MTSVSLLLEEESLLVSQGKLLATPRGSVPGDDKAYAGVEKPKKSKSRCYKCGLQGHLARDCTSKKKDGESPSNSDPAQVATATRPFRACSPSHDVTAREGMWEVG